MIPGFQGGSRSRSSFFVEHDLSRKPVPTFRDHALLALVQPHDGCLGQRAEMQLKAHHRG